MSTKKKYFIIIILAITFPIWAIPLLVYLWVLIIKDIYEDIFEDFF